MKLSDITIPPVRHSIVYGPPKVGKTTLIGELAEHGFEIDFCDLENGSSTLVKSLSAAAKERVNIIHIPDTREWPIGIETMLKLSRLWFIKTPKKVKICDTHGKIDCPVCLKDMKATHSEIDFSTYGPRKILAIDSLTQLSLSSMNQITKGQDIETLKPGWPEFQGQGNHLGYFLGNIQNAPINICLTSHEMGIELEDQGVQKEKIMPVGGTKNFSRTVSKYFDDVIYMRIYNRRHQAISETTEIAYVMAGSRAGVVLSKEEKPSLLEIYTGERPPSSKEVAKTILQGVNKT